MSAAGGGAVAVNFPALPEFEKRQTYTGPTTGLDTRVEQLSPEQEQKLKGTQEATQRQIAATGKERELKEREATIGKQDIELQQFAAEAEHNLQTGPEATAAKAYVDWARQHTRDEESKLAAMPPPRLFKDGDGWKNVRKAIGLGLAGLGDGMIAAAAIRAGHAPTSGHTAAEIIDRDLAEQRAAIDKQKDTVLMARTGLQDATEARRAVMADLELKAKYLYKKAELLTRARLTALKMDQASIDQTKEINDLVAKQANAEAEYVKSHTMSATNRYDSGKSTTETINRQPTAGAGGEGKVPANTAALARQAITEIERLKAEESLPGQDALAKAQDNTLRATAADTATERGDLIKGSIATAGRAADIIPRTRYEGITGKDLENIQRMDSALQMLTHVMSGANAPAEEIRKKTEAFGWTPNDNEKSMRTKLDRALELAKQYTGGAAGAPVAPAAAPGGPTQPPPFQPAQRGASVQASPTSLYTPARIAKAKAVLDDRKASEAEKKPYREFLKEARAAGVR